MDPPAVIRATRSPRGARPNPEGVAQEVAQRLRVRLLVRHGEEALPRIAQHTGLGELRSWLRVAAVREAPLIRRRGQKEVPAQREALERVPGPETDPEMRYLQQMYQEPFEAALRDAFARLDRRERSLLRYHFLEGLTLEQTAALHDVHRATAARWITRARRVLFEETRRLLEVRLSVTPPEMESLLRLVRSRLDVSVRRLLATGGAEEAKSEPQPGKRG